MKLPPECWCFAREAGKAPTFWVNSYAETSLQLIERVRCYANFVSSPTSSCGMLLPFE
ncbi:hypothetical protein NDI41_22090 [Leptolyngbya sp. NM2-A1]